MKNKFRIIPFEFNILMGLPGSGKTYWAEHNYPTSNFCNHNGRMIVSLDKYKDFKDKENWIWAALDEEFKNYMDYCHLDKIDVCIDGPITTYEHLEKVIDDVLLYMKVYCKWKQYNSGDYELIFNIHQWNEDRQTCFHNDRYRNRGIKANASIALFEYTEIDENFIKLLKRHLKNFQTKNDMPLNIKSIKKISHMVEKSTLYEQKFEPACDNKYGHGDDEQGMYLYSEDWCLGGEWGDCWGHHGVVYASSPEEFTEFDDFLESIVPNISFLQYKKLRNHCVEQIEWHESDYYSSGTNRACWRCDMKKLYNMMKEMNLIED